ncbi:MAG: FGGY family carbohydrate kinase [Gammaproteobacteria bacterium]
MSNDLEKPVTAVAIDLGSTRFKLGCVDGSGRLSRVAAIPAPRLSGDGLVRQVDAAIFLRRVERLWDEFEGEWAGMPFGLVCQRSTFVVWDRRSGRPLTPVVSWQDRRAADWCEEHAFADNLLRRRTGLLLSPHYAGPKLAAMMQADPELAARLKSGDALFGTLDTWLTWVWTDGAIHRSDLTMAARTAMVDIVAGDWCKELLDLYGVPRSALPDIVATDATPVELRNGARLTASIADQASGALAVLDPHLDAALVNLGTGAFVLRPIGDASVRRDGYLTGPILSSAALGERSVLEGTINGAGPAVDRFGRESAALPTDDPAPEAFAIPDLAGLGAPHWRPEFELTLSRAARQLEAPIAQRRVVIEGLLFRVYEILRDVSDDRLPADVFVSGGLVRDPAVAQGLATLLDAPVHVFDEAESTLLGVARLAMGVDPFAAADAERVMPSAAGAYLRDKFNRWETWMRGILTA